MARSAVCRLTGETANEDEQSIAIRMRSLDLRVRQLDRKLDQLSALLRNGGAESEQEIAES
jgi:hypothetical protein